MGACPRFKIHWRRERERDGQRRGFWLRTTTKKKTRSRTEKNRSMMGKTRSRRENTRSKMAGVCRKKRQYRYLYRWQSIGCGCIPVRFCVAFNFDIVIGLF
uniref:Uncharacterized protein n=1 Tax=Cannabis sativa TaxID=3483 RepID=A0A803R593_CANSA